jgi:hypothetical protein
MFREVDRDGSGEIAFEEFEQVRCRERGGVGLTLHDEPPVQSR